MKFIIKMLGIIAFLCSNAHGQETKGFELKGNIEGLQDGSMIYLTTQSKDTLLKTVSKGCDFNLAGFIEGGANFYFIKVDTNLNKISPKSRSSASNALWLTNNKMTLKGKLRDWKNLILTGSEAHLDFVKFKNLEDKNKDKPEWANLIEGFIQTHADSYFTPFIKGVNIEKTYNLLTERAKRSYWGIQLERLIKQKEIINASQKSRQLPDFTISFTNGKRASIYDLAKSHKLTLIDFWASWCGPCRAANPKLLKAYNAFHDKGFNIIGVSRDKSETAWKKAVIEDNTPWIHGLDNIEDAGNHIFGLNAIPGYVLINQNGKIIQLELISSTSIEQIRKFKGKSLNNDLYEIVKQLLEEGIQDY